MYFSPMLLLHDARGTHFLCFIFKLIVVWNRALSFKPLQVIETTLVILHVYLMLVSIEVFATL